MGRKREAADPVAIPDESSRICKSFLQLGQHATGRRRPIADKRRARRSSQTATRACARARPLPARLRGSVRGLYSHYSHHNSEQMCGLLSERNLIISTLDGCFRQRHTDPNALPVFFHTAQKHDGFLFFFFLSLTSVSELSHHHKIDQQRSAVGSGAAPPPHTAGGGGRRSAGCVPRLPDAHPSVPQPQQSRPTRTTSAA